MRSDPLTPWPANFLTVGAVARVDQPLPGAEPVPGVLVLPTLNSKSAAVMFARVGMPVMSIRIPSIPLPKLETLEYEAVWPGIRGILSVATAALGSAFVTV